MVGGTCLATVGSFFEVEPNRAVFRILFVLVLRVRSWQAGLVAFEDLQWTTAILAAELRVLIDKGYGEVFHLPEGFIASSDLDSAAFDLNLHDFFALFLNLGGHDLP